jgi:hypothetical protein
LPDQERGRGWGRRRRRRRRAADAREIDARIDVDSEALRAQDLEEAMYRGRQTRSR